MGQFSKVLLASDNACTQYYRGPGLQTRLRGVKPGLWAQQTLTILQLKPYTANNSRLIEPLKYILQYSHEKPVVFNKHSPSSALCIQRKKFSLSSRKGKDDHVWCISMPSVIRTKLTWVHQEKSTRHSCGVPYCTTLVGYDDKSQQL